MTESEFYMTESGFYFWLVFRESGDQFECKTFADKMDAEFLVWVDPTEGWMLQPTPVKIVAVLAK
jgi:hypothetical protein